MTTPGSGREGSRLVRLEVKRLCESKSRGEEDGRRSSAEAQQNIEAGVGAASKRATSCGGSEEFSEQSSGLRGKAKAMRLDRSQHSLTALLHSPRLAGLSHCVA